jgi:hypothetical protein
MEFILNLKLTIVKNRNLYYALAFLAIGSFMMTSCSKGSTGPAGAAGAVGPAGPDSVQYSGWITLNMHLVVNSGDSTYQQSITAPSLTSSVLNQDAIIGYVYYPDPVTGDSSYINASNFFQEYYTAGYIDLVSFTGDWSTDIYRYVIVPTKITVTNASGSLQTYTSDQMKKMDYPTLTKILGIPAKGSSVQTGARLQ